MIVSSSGRPAAGKEILDRLHEIDPNLGLMFADQGDHSWWSITLKWPLSDRRWEMVQRGEIGGDNTFDIIAHLPPDCSADEAYSYVVNNFRQRSGREDIRQMLERVHLYNQKRSRDNTAPTMELAQELIETNAKTMFEDIGKGIPRTMAPKSHKDSDRKRLEEFLREGP